MMTTTQLLAVLDSIEDVDARNLVWGLTDESWLASDILDRIETIDPGGDPQAALYELVHAGLLVEVPSTYPVRYRTRMAEAMRLMARLRQLFPRKPWRAAPRLVADFRFRHEPRRFPRRELTVDAVIDRLSALELNPSEIAAARAVLGTRRLSVFQSDAAGAVFDALGDRADRGVVVGAGTGSGKTLAFYLPALAHLAARPGPAEATGVIAVYPRNELLKDQLATALHEIRNLRAAGQRQLRLGAFFGPAPLSARYTPDERSGWRRTSAGWLCPFLDCLQEGCGGRLVWLDIDRQSGRERLVCEQCRQSVGEQELALTRFSMQQRPPELVFTTTEMLNRTLSDGWSMRVFGVGPEVRRAPALLLLDEIHTYEGISGAQVAYLLRRWRYLVGKPVTWVGLSATLANAPTFFATLCGLPEDAVADIRPEPDDLDEMGREYQVILRGDPASQSALLSTSIQALMLLRRVLDDDATGGHDARVFGTRLFAFCDNLDLVNRLYRQLLDAEGRDPFGRVASGGHVLAGLRLPTYAERYGSITDWPDRDSDGQYWWLVDQLGFGDRSLAITRTSSQDTGVDRRADVVVATASLEVGYDDPEVGAVLQHKAPRDVAQFIQRRGRAGRVQTQRPWTVVVLSDYGRDRAAYQDYETLLDPELPAKSLPLGNQSVRKMQASMCMLEWVGQRLDVGGRTRRNVRSVLVGPESNDEFRRAVANLMTRILEGGDERADLIRHVGRSLDLNGDELVSVCWEQPRSLLLDVVPTALRRLDSSWGEYRDGRVVANAAPWVRDQPLPEFIPRTLFSDLCLPEVTIRPPDGYDPAADTSLPIAMALSELTPGRVTLRWAVRSVRGLWIPPPLPGNSLDLQDHAAPEAEIVRTVEGPQGQIPLVRPTAISPVVPDANVLDSSNGRLAWQFLAEPVHAGIELVRPRGGPFENVVIDLKAYLHSGRGALRTWRYATCGTADIARRSGRVRFNYGFTYQGDTAAIGFEAIVDALIARVRPPNDLAAFGLDDEPRRLRQLRRDRFGSVLRSALQTDCDLDPFSANWIIEIAVAIAAHHVSAGLTLDDLVSIPAAKWHDLADASIDGVLRGLDTGSGDEPALRSALIDTFDQQTVISSIVASLPELVAAPDDKWLPWLRARYLQTVGAAWQAAGQRLCPDFDVEADSVLDVVDSGDEAQIVLSDVSVGGGGLIESLAGRISEDPRRFDLLVAAALEPSDLEDVDRSLRLALDLLIDDTEVASCAQTFRSAETNRLKSWKPLISALVEAGAGTSHAAITALASRVFRTGSSTASDDLLRRCLVRWDGLEQTASFALDHHIACAVLASDPEIVAALRIAAPGDNRGDISWAQAVLLGLLWVSGEARRAGSLMAVNRFLDDPPLTERTLVLDSLGNVVEAVDVDAPVWFEDLSQRLGRVGRCRLVSVSGDSTRLKDALAELAVRPIELGPLYLFPRLESLVRNAGHLQLEVSLEEAPQ